MQGTGQGIHLAGMQARKTVPQDTRLFSACRRGRLMRLSVDAWRWPSVP